MEARVRHPRLLAALRTLLYLAAVVTAVALVGVAVSFLGFVALLSVVSLALVGDVSELVVLLVTGLGLVTLGSVGALLVAAVRRIDRFVVRTARVPSPVERVTTSYVCGEIDEDELERRLEGALSADDEVDDTAPRGRRERPSPGDRPAHRTETGTDAETV